MEVAFHPETYAVPWTIKQHRTLSSPRPSRRTANHCCIERNPAFVLVSAIHLPLFLVGGTPFWETSAGV
jgi:hypothetical protein